MSLSHQSLHNAGADTNLAAYLQDAHTALAELVNSFFHRRFHPAASKLCAVGACPRKPGVDSFPDDTSLELSEHAKHLKHCLARGGRRIETLLVEKQIHDLVVQPLQDAQQIG